MRNLSKCIRNKKNVQDVLKNSMDYKCDLILTDGSSCKGILTIDEVEGKIYFEEKEVESEYIVSPSFFNSHIHLGDSLVKDPPPMKLEELVGPGGFKFRILSTDERAINAIKNSINIALASGTSALADFREEGIEGLKVLKQADDEKLCFPLARPSNAEEAEELAKDDYVKGFGMSSIRDHELSFIE
jgi:cytosine/adenosine deaminase-related metal-dependent hydrolase